jgi:SAM-dependent methyltransferase
MTEKLLVPVYLPSWLRSLVVRTKRAFMPPAAAPEPINISGERNIEWAFLSTEMPSGPGTAFEFGCEQGYMSLLAAHKGYRVIANDLQPQSFTWRHSAVEFLEGDFTKLDLPADHFDLAINCSSVEHVGVAGRYGITVQQDEGDLEVMRRLAKIIKPGGLLLMSAPCGRDAIMAPWCRVYGPQRMPHLFAPFEVFKEAYWIKDAANRWVTCSKEQALSFQPVHAPTDPHGCAYALGGFVLRKPHAAAQQRQPS